MTRTAAKTGDSAQDSDPGEGGITHLPFTLRRRDSVADQVHAALREAILNNRLAPGAAISENSICRQFSVSRTPVRAALQRLSDEGLADVFPQQGSFVSRIKVGGIHDSHFVRRTLEVALLREAAPRWTAEASRAARDSLTAQSAAIESGDVDEFHHEDERFHQIIALQAGRAGVWPTVLAAKTQLTRFIRFSGNSERLPTVVREHEAILDALDRGQAAAAQAALIAHLDKIFVLFDGLPEEERRHFEP